MHEWMPVYFCYHLPRATCHFVHFQFHFVGMKFCCRLHIYLRWHFWYAIFQIRCTLVQTEGKIVFRSVPNTQSILTSLGVSVLSLIWPFLAIQNTRFVLIYWQIICEKKNYIVGESMSYRAVEGHDIHTGPISQSIFHIFDVSVNVCCLFCAQARLNGNQLLWLFLLLKWNAPFGRHIAMLPRVHAFEIYH